jgi:Dyp-type peroxidase family
MTDLHLDFSDIQGNILRGYGFPAAAYIFVRIDGAEEGRGWVGELIDPLTTNEEWTGGKPDWTLNVAFTCAGLEALGVTAAVIDRFPLEFREGMAARAAELGDVGPSSPEHWDEGLGTGDAHALVTINARTQEALDERLEWLRSRIETSQGLKIVHEQVTALLPLAREHFGFSDGMAQPSIEGDRLPNRPGTGIPESRGRWRPLRAGEFILGYEDEDGGLPEAPPEPLGKNGTFMVYRKLHQDVALFRNTIKDIGEKFPGGPELLAAKIVGRWPDGTSLVQSPDQPDASISTDPDKLNDFRYEDDPEGLRCPLGAHVRRVYPRDALGWGGNMSTRHRLIRRGLPYGPPLPASAAEDDRVERGLVFICFQANIKRQFEVVQGQWINDGNAFGLGHDKDYLLGDPHGTGKMTIQGSPPFFVSPQPSFVTTKGGEYLFMPGVTALKALAAGLA